MRVDAVGPGAYAFATPNEETRMLNRRRLLQAGSLAPVALSAGLAHSQAKPDKLTILSHRVHMSVITGTKGGNAIEDWSKRNGVGIDWVTLDTGPLHERLFREASLGPPPSTWPSCSIPAPHPMRCACWSRSTRS
jgi:hypothetical protein